MPPTLDRLWLPVNDPVLGAGQPVIDGFTSTRGTGVVSSESEDRAYATGARIEYSAGTFPDVIFTAVKSTGVSEVNFAWVVNSDTGFQLEDVLVLCVRPTHPIPAGATHDEARRIDIYPVSPQGADGNPAGHLMGTHDIRTNQPPSDLQWYAGLNGGAWNLVGAPPSGVEVRCRSWKLNNPSIVPPYHFQQEHGWAIELQLPLELDGVSLTGQFALFWALYRRGVPGAVPFLWPRSATVTAPTGAIDDTLSIPESQYGEANIPALTGDAAPPGVRVARHATTLEPEMGVLNPTPYSNIITVNQDNHFACNVQNTSSDQADDVIATFSLANWGSPSPTGWRPIPVTSGANPAATLTDAVEVPSVGTQRTTSFMWHPVPGGPSVPTAANKHQCMLVVLDSIGGDVYFTEAGARRNMEFAGLSEIVREAEIGASGFGKQPRGLDLEFELVAFAREIPLTRRVFASLRERIKLEGEPEENICWAIFFKTYRNLQRTITIRKDVDIPLYELVGDWAELAVHHGRNDVPRLEVSGKNLKELGEGRWTAQTKPGRAIKLKYRIWTEPYEGRREERQPPGGPGEVIKRDPRFENLILHKPGGPLIRAPWDPRPLPGG